MAKAKTAAKADSSTGDVAEDTHEGEREEFARDLYERNVRFGNHGAEQFDDLARWARAAALAWYPLPVVEEGT